jgi:hypothetical protein
VLDPPPHVLEAHQPADRLGRQADLPAKCLAQIPAAASDFGGQRLDARVPVGGVANALRQLGPDPAEHRLGPDPAEHIGQGTGRRRSAR